MLSSKSSTIDKKYSNDKIEKKNKVEDEKKSGNIIRDELFAL